MRALNTSSSPELSLSLSPRQTLDDDNASVEPTINKFAHRSRPPSRASSAVESNSLSLQSNVTRGFKRFPSSDSLNSNSIYRIQTATRPTIVSKPPPRITTTSTAYTTRNSPATSSPLSSSSSAPSPNLSRPPLRTRDQNVTLMTRQPAKSTTTSMPYDRSTNMGATRPQMPSLSATAARGSAKTPVTPKIASKTQPAPKLAAATPLARRTARANTPNLDLSAATNDSLRDDFSSSRSSLLGSNITPRSGSRQVRVDSANSTPTGTPVPERNDGWDPRASSNSGSSYDQDPPRRNIVTFSPIHGDMNGSQRTEAQNTQDSKFFYASEVRSPQPQQSQQHPRPGLAKSNSFFYANGGAVPDKPASSTPFTPVLGQQPQHDNFSSKFMYANGTPDLQPPNSAPPTARGPPSTISSSSRPTISRNGTNTSLTAQGSTQRPVSPVKFPTSAPLPPAVNNNRGQMVSPPQIGPVSNGNRRASLEKPSRVGGHSRASSLATVEQASSLKSSSPLATPDIPPATAPINANQTFTLASILQAAEDFEEVASPDDVRSELHSPTKSTHGNDQFSELVAEARRDRKVQDLEIRNASLEAINRTLERQMRKQQMELRRYRRLSRSGRLSIASTAASTRVPSNYSVSEGLEGMHLSELSEYEESEEEEEEEESDLSDSESGSEAMSPSIMEARDARHRQRDEKRLQLDLSKHQELLIDSQRMNQSIKRCLNWSDELIKEGQKALAYHVRVSDVELGGRVLPPLDEEEEDQTLDHLIDATLEVPSSIKWGIEPQDRDSGIELPGDGG